MTAPGHDGLLVRPLTDDTGEGDLLQHGLVSGIVVAVVVDIVRGAIGAIGARNDGARGGALLLSLGDLIPLAVELPAVLVVLAHVEILAIIPKATEAGLLVVLAHVGGEVSDGDGAYVGGGLDGTDGATRGVRVLLDEGGLVCQSFVRAVGLWCRCGLRSGKRPGLP